MVISAEIRPGDAGVAWLAYQCYSRPGFYVYLHEQATVDRDYNGPRGEPGAVDRGRLNLILIIDDMDSVDLSADLTALPTDHAARLLSESPLVGRSNHPDLSSSDLLSEHDVSRGDRSQSHAVDEEQDEDEVEEALREAEGEDEEAQIRRARKAARMREEKLQNDLFLLKKLNSAFSLYTDALRATQSSTEVSRYSTPLLFKLV